MNPTSILANRFLENKEIAMAGVSRNKKKFGYKVFDLLRSHGYTIYPLHPEAKEIDGVECFKSFTEIPENVKNLYIVTPQYATENVVKQSLIKKFDMVWFQQKSETANSVNQLKDKGSEVITGSCMFMFIDPKGGHTFHKRILHFFGKI